VAVGTESLGDWCKQNGRNLSAIKGEHLPCSGNLYGASLPPGCQLRQPTWWSPFTDRCAKEVTLTLFASTFTGWRPPSRPPLRRRARNTMKPPGDFHSG